MVDPTKYTYQLVLVTEKGKRYDITSFVEDLGWDDLENELASRLSCKIINDKTTKGRISSMAKPGCYLYLYYRYKTGTQKEVFRGRIIDWNPVSKNSGQTLSLKSYDSLYDFQESEDSIYIASGSGTKEILTDFFAKWGIKMGKYSGPNVTHGIIKHDKKKYGSIVKELLKEAKGKGGGESVIRSEKGKVNILKVGSNKDILHFEETINLTSASHKISTAGMVTRVRIVGEKSDEGRRPVEATVDGKTKYGIRQKILTRGSDESIGEAKKEANEILKEEGQPKETVKISTFDVPFARKGDIIHLKMSTGSGYYQILSVSHDCDQMEMQMDLKKTKIKSSSESNKDNGKKGAYAVGDIVTFRGGEHYVSSDAKYPASRGLKPGKAKITYSNPGSPHPWHLETEDWATTHVWGWVDEGTFD